MIQALRRRCPMVLETCKFFDKVINFGVANGGLTTMLLKYIDRRRWVNDLHLNQRDGAFHCRLGSSIKALRRKPRQ